MVVTAQLFPAISATQSNHQRHPHNHQYLPAQSSHPNSTPQHQQFKAPLF